MAYTSQIGRRFWYEFDGATKYSTPFMSIISRAGGFGVQNDYKTTRSQGSYPAAFKQKFLPRRGDWITIADIQTATIGNILGSDWSDIQAAFEDFGQGTLLETDPIRQANDDSIHMMDIQDANSPPVGYHRWHASIRVIQLLNIGDAAWWEKLDGLVGLAWGIQSFARPKQQTTPNPAIAQADMQDLRSAWLGLAPDCRDRQYDLTARPAGYHPSPKHPA